MPRCGATWSRPRSPNTSIEPARRQQRAKPSARRSALDARRLHPRVEPVLRRGLGPQRRASRDPRQLRRRRRSRSSGSSTPICCRCRRCCCSAARSATISDGGGCSSSAPAFSPSLRWSARWRRACRSCSPPARAQGIGAALLLPNSLALLNAAFSGEKRGRAVGIWAASGAAHGGGRAADRRLAGRHGRLAGDLLHQPAAGARRDPACAALRRGKPRSRRRAAPTIRGRCSPPPVSAG